MVPRAYQEKLAGYAPAHVYDNASAFEDEVKKFQI